MQLMQFHSSVMSAWEAGGIISSTMHRELERRNIGWLLYSGKVLMGTYMHPEHPGNLFNVIAK